MAGRPTAYKKGMEGKAVAYINGGYEEYGHVIPSIIGLAKVLNVATSTLYNWNEDKDHPFLGILESCKDEQHMVLLNKGLTGDFNSNITKLALGKHGYSEKQETNLTGGLTINISPNDADTL